MTSNASSSPWVQYLCSTLEPDSTSKLNCSRLNASISHTVTNPLGTRVSRELQSEETLCTLSLLDQCSVPSYDSYANPSLRISDFGSDPAQDQTLDFINVASSSYGLDKPHIDPIFSSSPSKSSPRRSCRTDINRAYFETRASELLSGTPSLLHSLGRQEVDEEFLSTKRPSIMESSKSSIKSPSLMSPSSTQRSTVSIPFSAFDDESTTDDWTTRRPKKSLDLTQSSSREGHSLSTSRVSQKSVEKGQEASSPTILGTPLGLEKSRKVVNQSNSGRQIDCELDSSDLPSDALLNRLRMSLSSRSSERGRLQSDIEQRLLRAKEETNQFIKNRSLEKSESDDEESKVEKVKNEPITSSKIGVDTTFSARANSSQSMHSKKSTVPFCASPANHHLRTNPRITHSEYSSPRLNTTNQIKSSSRSSPNLNVLASPVSFSSSLSSPMVPPLSFNDTPMFKS
ncbi:hypothetical protein RCL1_006794 [Eukaryota sp. TZLM3-RCL]